MSRLFSLYYSMSRIVYTDGCVASGLTVDGEFFKDLSLEEQKAIMHKIIDSAQDPSSLQNMLIDYVETAGEYEYLYTCEECGDSVCCWTIDMVLN